MRTSNSQLTNPASNSIGVMANINHDFFAKKSTNVLPNSLINDGPQWKTAGLMFYSIHQKAKKLNHDLNKTLTRIVRKGRDSNVAMPASLFANSGFSNSKVDVDNMSTDDMVFTLISDSLNLRKKAYEMADFAKSIGDDESFERLMETVTKIGNNAEKLNYYMNR